MNNPIEEEIDMRDLQKIGVKVDFLPKNLKIGAMFQMGGYNFIHIGRQKAILVMFDDEIKELPKA